jgi:hypothetical protein
MYNTMNTFLQSPDPINNPGVGYKVLDGAGAPLMPGRPVADAGPDRTVGTGATTLSTAGSLYADTYLWSLITNPGGATLSSSTGVQTTFNAVANGTYVVQLIASKGGVPSDPVQLTIVVNSVWPLTVSPLGAAYSLPNPLPSAIRFADIKAVLQQAAPPGSKTCITCHTTNPPGNIRPPILYSNIDRNGDGIIASGIGGTDDIWLYTEVVGRINFSDIAASPLLRHPAGHNHNGGVLAGFGDAASGVPADKLPPGAPRRSYYDMFLNWILNGAPY